MKYFLPFILFCLLLNQFFLSSKASEESPAGREHIHDFGTLQEGETPSHTFCFKNTTPVPLKILKIRTPCGCTKAEIKTQSLLPGESTDFSVKFISKGRRGKISKKIYLLTDSKALPMSVYIIRANIETGSYANINAGIKSDTKQKNTVSPEFCDAPAEISLGNFLPGEARAQSFEISNKGNIVLELDKGVFPQSFQFKTAFPLKIPPGKTVKIDFSFKAPSYTGKFQSRIMFRTNDPSRTNLWVKTRYTVRKK